MDPARAEGYLPVLHAFLEGSGTGFSAFKGELPKERASHVVTAEGVTIDFEADELPEDMPDAVVGVLNFSDVIAKYDNCGVAGTQTKRNVLAKMAGNSRVKGAVLVMDSPGGSVQGTKLMSDAIRAFPKPVVGLVEDMAASAGYWIVSAADEVYAVNAISEIGSIGTYVSFMDMVGAYEKLGAKYHEIYATRSKDKNKGFREAVEGKYDSLRGMIDFINEEFIASVMENRAGKLNASLEDPFTGKLFFAERAFEVGLIDGMGSMDSAVSRVLELAASAPQSDGPGGAGANGNVNFNSTDMSLFNTSFPKVKELKGKNAEEVTDEQLKAANDELKGAGVPAFLVPQSEGRMDLGELVANVTELEANAEKLNGVQGELTAAQNDLKKANDELKAANDKVAELEAKLTGKPGAAATVPPKGEGNEADVMPEGDAGANEDWMKVAHNQQAFDDI